jgi:hypothetical protein
VLLFPNLSKIFWLFPRFARDDNDVIPFAFRGLPCARFLNGSAKVRACMFLPNLFSVLSEIFGVKFVSFCEELFPFFKAGCKDTVKQVTSKLFS